METPWRFIFPVLVTSISYLTKSPFPNKPSPLSVIATVLVASIPGKAVILTIVGSSMMLPSESSPSSEVSVTSPLFPGDDAVAITVFEMNPVLSATLLTT